MAVVSKRLDPDLGRVRDIRGSDVPTGAAFFIRTSSWSGTAGCRLLPTRGKCIETMPSQGHCPINQAINSIFGVQLHGTRNNCPRQLSSLGNGLQFDTAKCAASYKDSVVGAQLH